MSRPSKAEQERLEALEGMSALLDGVMRACGIVAVRLRQARRREPHLAGVLEPASEELALIVDSCDQAHEMVKAVLIASQARRTREDQGGER